MLGHVVKMQYKKSKPHKSYGYIKGSDDKEYWFSLMGISEEDIKIGDQVSFTGGENEKGYVAWDVFSFT